MKLDVQVLNRMITDFASGKSLCVDELEWLEQAVFSGAVHSLSRQKLPLLGIHAKTQLFESCFYRLESVRVLVLSGKGKRMSSVVEQIVRDIQEKCYGRFCPVGECFEASVCVLRFLRAVCPYETEWIAQMEAGILNHLGDKVRTKAVQRYVESALLENKCK